MRTIAVMNQKGGVGKTTTAVNLSAALAEAGSRVCLIDIDPQAHATLHLGMTPQPGDTTIYDVLTSEVSLEAARSQVAENLWVVPSQSDLAATFGLGTATVVDKVTVRWPGSRPRVQTWTGLATGKRHTLEAVP